MLQWITNLRIRRLNTIMKCRGFFNPFEGYYLRATLNYNKVSAIIKTAYSTLDC